jgi:exosortase/archaeosortase family protein
MKKLDSFYLLLRYISLVIFGLNKSAIISIISTPFTVYPVYWLLNTMYGAKLLIGNKIFFQGHYIELISACIGDLAIYLLLILNLTTPMAVSKRVKSILFITLSFIALNIARIMILSTLIANGYTYFDITHELTWYFGSTILVIIIWFSNIWIFKIKEIPIYSDIMGLINAIKSPKKHSHPYSHHK